MDQSLQELVRSVRAHPDDTDLRVKLFRMAKRSGISAPSNPIIMMSLELWEQDIIQSLTLATSSAETRLRRDPEIFGHGEETFEHFYTYWGNNYERIIGNAVADPNSQYGQAVEYYFRQFQSSYANHIWRAVLVRLHYDFDSEDHTSLVRIAYLWDSEAFQGNEFGHRANLRGALTADYHSESWRREDPDVILKRDNTLITSDIPPNFEPYYDRAERTLNVAEFFQAEISIPLDFPTNSREDCYECQHGNPCSVHTRIGFVVRVIAQRTINSTRIYLESLEALRQNHLRRIGLMVLEINYPFN